MNLNGDEKRIRQLFRELSCDEQRRAPEFAGVLEAANSGTAGSRHRTRSFALAPAVAALCVGMLIAVSFAVRHSKPEAPAAPTEAAVSPQSTERPTRDVSAPQVADTPGKAERRTIIRRIPRRRTSDELAIRMKSLSAWQSPTASLLKAPGEDIFKSLPRLGESLQSIKSFSPDEFN
ncbi:MAG: hypothetical protein AABO57_21685 [Acidobacteriota bacterium]